ncbi:hypothetical protein D3C81_1379280 [compost metagenome]
MRLYPAQGNPGGRQFMGGMQRRRQWCAVHFAKQRFGRIQFTNQQQAANLQVSRVRCVQPVTVAEQQLPGGLQRLHRPAQVPRRQRHFRLGHHATRPRQRFVAAKGFHRALQQRFGAGQITELGHGNAT